LRAVVTGADGFLGANLVRALTAAGHEVTGTALNRKGHTSLDALGISCRIEYGDVTDAAFVDRVILGSEAEWVFHLAAVSIVRKAQADPRRAHTTNIIGTLNVLEACRASAHVKAVLVASSDKAYGDHQGRAYREDMPLLPVAPYEVSKAAADLIAQSYIHTYGLPVIVTRCATLYGPGDLNWSRLVPNSCKLAVNGRAPVIHAGAERMSREYLHVTDAARACIALATSGAPGAYNVGSGTWAEAGAVAAMVAEQLGAPPPVVQGKAVPFAEIPRQELCTYKVRALWEPEIPLDAGIAETARWYRDYLLPSMPLRRRTLCVS
jgi:CDP-glucose 4,6-dehydratase